MYQARHGKKDATYVIQYGFHQLYGHLGLLDQIILGVFDLEPSGVLICGTSCFQAGKIERLADEQALGNHTNSRLFGSIKLESGGVDGPTCLHCDSYIRFESLFPWPQEPVLDRSILLNPSVGDLLQSITVRDERILKLVIIAEEVVGRGRRSPVKSMGESLVLDRFRLDRSRCGKVGPLEVGGCEVSDGRADADGDIDD